MAPAYLSGASRVLHNPGIGPVCPAGPRGAEFVIVPWAPNHEIALILGVLAQTETIVLEPTDPGAVGTGIPS
jgi:hypothetical protein